MVIVVLELHQRWFGGLWSTNLTAGQTAVLMFRGGFFIILIHTLQLMGNNGRNTVGFVVVIPTVGTLDLGRHAGEERSVSTFQHSTPKP